MSSTDNNKTQPTMESAVAALDPIVALLALVQMTGDRTLLHKYGPTLDGTQNTTREAFVAITGEVAHAEADQNIANEVRQLLLNELKSNRPALLRDLDPPLFHEMARLALGLELPEMSMEPAYQHGGFTTDTRIRVPSKLPAPDFKVLVVGAGMVGINAAVKLKQAGFNFQIIESRDNVGGTWLVNTYPGAAVDTPSINYSFSFEPNASWTKYYPNGPEFFSYLSNVTDKYNVRDRIDFNTFVKKAEWDEARNLWVVHAVRNGKDVVYEGNVLINATGPNADPKYPNVKNLDAFKGPVIHSAAWDNSVDLKGKKVVLVGAACSGVQVATAIADTVGDLSIVMRQPEYLIPNPQAHAPVDALERWAMENIPFVAQWRRLQGLSSQLQDMRGMIMIDEEHRAKTGGVSPLNDGIREMCVNYIKSHFPNDPQMVEILTPDYPVFAKRPILDCGFYETIKKPNVHLVKGGLASCEANAVILADGTRIECDVLLLSTGYNMYWGNAFEIVGRNGKTLQEAFTPSPLSYEGMLAPGFPNFALTGCGPYSFLVANHAVVSEQQIHYVLELLQTMVDEDLSAVEVSKEACSKFVEEADQALTHTTWVNKGTAHGYYRHASGKVIIAIPKHNSQIWHDLRQPRIEDMVVTKRKDAKPALVREKTALSI